MEFIEEGREFGEDIPDEDWETTFINPSNMDESLIQTSVEYHRDPIVAANKVLTEGGLPDLDTIIENKQRRGITIDKKLLTGVIVEEKPKGEEGLNKVIREYNRIVQAGGTGDEYTSETFYSRKALNKYASERLPLPPSDTPGVPQDVQTKIDIKVSELNVENINHRNFIPLEKGGLAVKTSEGSKTITQKNPKLFLERPNIPFQEYESLFGFDRKEYVTRVKARNAFVRDEIESKTTAAVKSTTTEFYNPAFEDPYEPLLPTPSGESSEW